MKSIFITGTSSGIGFALANKYLDEGWRVYGVSRKRSTIEHPNFSSLAFDISDFEHYTFFDTLFHSITHLDLIVLNAGILGDI